MSSHLLCENMSRLWASVVAAEFSKLGARAVFIAPGMRNAPLIAAFKAQESFELHIGMDERALAYQALGYAKTSGLPGILLCTSGTAAANFYPAVIEANKSQVPLIIISADRPLELAQTDANQTINQKHLFGHYAKHFLDLGSPDSNVSLRALARMSAHAFELSTRAPSAPVHINLAFREPLDGKQVELSPEVLAQVQHLQQRTAPARQSVAQQACDISAITAFLNQAKRPLIVIGELKLHEVSKARQQLLSSLRTCSHHLNIDVTSSLKFDFTVQEGLVPTFDHPEVYDYFHRNPPDLIVHFGGRLTSKHYYRFLQEHSDAFPVLHVHDAQALSDSGHATTHSFVMNPTHALSALANHWGDACADKVTFHQFIQQKIQIIENSHKLAYPYLSKRLMEMLPANHRLAVGNSTFIRSFDSYASLEKAKSVDVLTHRGVSGIEGFFASSSGATIAERGPITLALGDVSAMHDLNSLELVAKAKAPVICVVVNNYGGGIFTLLNLEKGEELYPIITSPHEIKLAPIAAAFGIKTWQVYQRHEFEQAYQEALALGQSAFIEVLVDTDANNTLYQQLKTIKLS